MIKGENLKKKFIRYENKKIKKEFYADNGITFEANDGKIIGILGPNGAGKTTLLRMIALMIGVTGTSLLSIITFINYVVVFTDTSAGKIDWLNITLMVVPTIIYISIVLTYIIKQYKSEKILFSKE